VVRVSDILKPVVVREYGLDRRMTHGGVKKDSARTKFCQELGRPDGQCRRESEEAIVVMKRVMIVERRAST